MKALALSLALALAHTDDGFVPAAAEVEAPPKSNAARWATFGVIVAGAGLAGTGVGFRYSAGEHYDRIDRGYPALDDYAQLQAVARTGNLHQQLAAAFLIGGAVVMVLGAVLSMVLQ
ncbi:MAG: hypothetical protein JNK82_29305 [Myxococcaceae bacterium]|nr:hypothetical protein [Myxococcaceae bacterium]